MSHIFITCFCILLTLGTYIFAQQTHAKYPMIITTPIFLATTIIILVLYILNISYEQYTFAKEIMTFLLGPATISLAVPLYKHREIIFKHTWPILISIFIGTIATISSAMLLANILHFSTNMMRSLTLKSITIPIASEVAEIISADPSLVLAFVMITGMAGAMFGSLILNIANIHHPIARGLAFGTIAHGIGTSRAIQENELSGASSSVAMGLAAILTSLFLPFVLPLLL